MTKEQKIKESWGEKLDLYKPNSDGWSSKIIYDWDKFDFKGFDTKVVGHGMYKLRPESLKGVEDNNGWTRIKNGNSITLPEYKKGDLYEVYNIETESSYPCRFTAKEVKQQFDYKHITHYRLVERTKFPIY